MNRSVTLITFLRTCRWPRSTWLNPTPSGSVRSALSRTTSKVKSTFARVPAAETVVIMVATALMFPRPYLAFAVTVAMRAFAAKDVLPIIAVLCHLLLTSLFFKA
jgi:hypothetical protein